VGRTTQQTCWRSTLRPPRMRRWRCKLLRECRPAEHLTTPAEPYPKGSFAVPGNKSQNNPERIRTGREGGLTGWLNTDQRGQRQQRMEVVGSSSPASDDFWYQKLKFTPGADGKYTAQQRAEVMTAKRAYFARLRKASVAAMKDAKIAKLKALTAKLEAELAAEAAGTEI
jgi:hypothetical protein